jgi:hypothetical protein
MSGQQQVRADARNVVDWYQRELAARTHDLAFAQCALQESAAANEMLMQEIGALREEMQAALAAHHHVAPSPEDPKFAEWIAEHWDAIQDARIAHALEHPQQPAVLEQP